MSHSDRKALVDRAHTCLSVSKQCKILNISRSSIYYHPKEASPETLSLMKRLDELFMLYPFYGSRQMTGHLRREGVSVGRPVSDT